MYSGLDIHNKCRICLTPDTDDSFIQLKGSKAEMFTEVIGVDLTIDGVKTESAICQNCFSKLKNFHDYKANGIRAHSEYFEIQRQLASSQCESNETEQAADEVGLTEPETTAIEPNSQSRVKHEPSVEFVLILPRPTIDQSEEDDDSNRKWVESVQLTKFDAKWPSESTLFQTFLTCQHCRVVVKHQRHLTRHLKTYSKLNGAGFECDICGVRYQNKSGLGRHMSKHSSERKFRCTECGIGFKSKLGLTAHQKTHNKTIACSTCQKKFSDYQLLKLHQMQHRHGSYATAPEESFDCSICDKSFLTPRHLKMHQEQVHDEKAAKCKVCDKVYKNRTSLLAHSRRHTKVECSICHKLVSKIKMASHFRSHGSHFKCDLCAYSSNFKSSLKRHIEWIHLLKKLVKDSKNQKNFSDFELIKKLQLKHGSYATSAEKKFQCDKCEKAFETPRSLNRHKRQVHPEKLFNCQICTKAFKTKSSLKEHIERTHLLMKLVEDSKSEDFSDFELLEKLQLKHGSSATSAEKKFQCDKCEKAFATQNTLKHHKRQVHVEKLFECQICKKAFKTKTHLKLHKAKVHSNLSVK